MVWLKCGLCVIIAVLGATGLPQYMGASDSFSSSESDEDDKPAMRTMSLLSSNFDGDDAIQDLLRTNDESLENQITQLDPVPDASSADENYDLLLNAPIVNNPIYENILLSNPTLDDDLPENSILNSILAGRNMKSDVLKQLLYNALLRDPFTRGPRLTTSLVQNPFLQSALLNLSAMNLPYLRSTAMKRLQTNPTLRRLQSVLRTNSLNRNMF